MDQFDRFQERGKYIRGLISWVGFKQFLSIMNERHVLPEKRNTRSAKCGSLPPPLCFISPRNRCAWRQAWALSPYWSHRAGRLFTLGKIYGFSNAETGWTSIMTSVIFFGGVQLLTVGVLGQYIGILFDEIKARPEYIIDEKKNF